MSTAQKCSLAASLVWIADPELSDLCAAPSTTLGGTPAGALRPWEVGSDDGSLPTDHPAYGPPGPRTTSSIVRGAEWSVVLSVVIDAATIGTPARVDLSTTGVGGASVPDRCWARRRSASLGEHGLVTAGDQEVRGRQQPPASPPSPKGTPAPVPSDAPSSWRRLPQRRRRRRDCPSGRGARRSGTHA